MGSFVEELLSDICNLEKAPEVPRLNKGVSTKHAFNYLAYARGSKQKTTKPGSARWMLDYRQKRALHGSSPTFLPNDCNPQQTALWVFL
ncbi:hypothetical protein CGCF413_v003201 [Colletotrichum fructicola]|nr:hypothetical protein CGCF413_v003201 [Colletotrichum fructicola]